MMDRNRILPSGAAAAVYPPPLLTILIGRQEISDIDERSALPQIELSTERAGSGGLSSINAERHRLCMENSR